MIRDNQRAALELLSFPAKLLGELPMELKIVVQVQGLHHKIGFNVGLATSFPSVARGGIDFDDEELRAIAVGVESERLRPADFKGFCLHKLHDASFRVTELLALDGARPSDGPSLSLARVLEALELEFVGFDWVEAVRQPSNSPRIDVAA